MRVAGRGTSGIVTCATLALGRITPDAPASPRPATNSQAYNATYDEVWNAVIEIVAAYKLIIGAIEKESGIIAIPDTTYSPEDAIEPKLGSTFGLAHTVTERRASFNIRVAPINQTRTEVQVNLLMRCLVRSGDGTELFPFQFTWYPAYSNGNTEARLLEGIATRLSVRGISP